jgi:DNA (cytosine-5)-methyltransferase 1
LIQVIGTDDINIDDNISIVTPDEASEIKVSTGFINNESILNDGQLTDEEESNLESSACNDNGCEDPDGDDDGGNTPSANPIIIEDAEEDEEYVSNISIDVDNISTRTGITKAELQAICVGGNTSVAIPTDLPELRTFITIHEGATKTAKALAKNSVLAPEARNFFLKKAQSYGYLWLKGEAQLGNEIRALKSRQGQRTDLRTVLGLLRSKKSILKNDYGLEPGQARDLARLTEELVEKEYKYALDNNDVPSRAHAMTFLSRPPEMSDDEKDEADAEKAGKQTKAKFKFETAFSDVPFNRRMRRRLKKNLYYASVAACVGSDEYYLEQHGLVCKVALECDPKRAEYYELMNAMRSKHKVDMIVGKLEEKFDELVKAFKKNKCELAKFTIPCQTFCPMRSKDWKDDDRLLLVLWCVKFIKQVKPKYILFENAKEFLGFSLPLAEDLSKHPIAQKMQQELNGRTIGQYLIDELGENSLGYNLNFAIENAAFYGTAQNRVRSIVLGSLEGVWNFPCPEEFAMPLWQAIGHLPSLEAGEKSEIPYHNAPDLHSDPETAKIWREAFAHLATGCRSKDNDPKYQLPGFGFFNDKGARKFWDKPSNTIDSGNGSPLCNRTLHPGRLKKDNSISDSRVLTLLEVFLVNGLPQSYEVPEKYRDKEAFIREVMGEIMLPRFLERICLEIPVPDDAWEEIEEDIFE